MRTTYEETTALLAKPERERPINWTEVQVNGTPERGYAVVVRFFAYRGRCASAVGLTGHRRESPDFVSIEDAERAIAAEYPWLDN